MYSAVFFGWPVTTMSPNRETSTPTCSIDVASTTSTGPRSRRSYAARLTGCGSRPSLRAAA